MDQLSQHIESLIFTSQGPITFAEIKEALEDSFEAKFKKADIQSAVDDVLEKYKSDTYSFEIVEIANGFQFFTKGAFHGTVGSRLKLTSKKRLSKAALETLAVIAYKQPVIKSECEKIRGVSCDYTIQKLLEKELISISGRADTPGRPLLYSTSQKFMDYFGLKDISDLPKPKDFQLPDEEIGDAAPIEELSEEQRERKTIVLEEMTDEVAAAILGEDFFPKPEYDEEIILEEEEATSADLEDESGETAPEAAIDDEPKDHASEEPSSTEESQQHYYGSGEPAALGENISPMSEEEATALLAADVLIEGEEDNEEEEEDITDEEDEAMVFEIEEDLKDIMQDFRDEEDESSDDEAFEFGMEVDSIAATQAILPTWKTKETEVDKAMVVTPTEEVLKTSIPTAEFIFIAEVDAIAAIQAVLPTWEAKETEVDKVVVVAPTAKVVNSLAPVDEFIFTTEVDTIIAMEAALPEWINESTAKEGRMIIGLSDEKLLSSTPIIDKIIDEAVVENIVITNEELSDTSPEGTDDSMKKKL